MKKYFHFINAQGDNPTILLIFTLKMEIFISNSGLKTPMVGFTESLNISVSATVILQHVTTKLKQTNIDWQLTNTEKLEK